MRRRLPETVQQMAIGQFVGILLERGIGRGEEQVGAPITIGWLGGTALGVATVAILPRPEALGLDLMLVAFAASMVTAMTRTRSDLLPVVVGAATALGVAELWGPAPAIIAAGLLGGGVAALGAGGRK